MTRKQHQHNKRKAATEAMQKQATKATRSRNAKHHAHHDANLNHPNLKRGQAQRSTARCNLLCGALFCGATYLSNRDQDKEYNKKELVLLRCKVGRLHFGFLGL